MGVCIYIERKESSTRMHSSAFGLKCFIVEINDASFEMKINTVDHLPGIKCLEAENHLF